MDPLSAFGISVGSMAFRETLREIAGDSAKDFAKDLFKGRLKDWSHRAEKSELERASLQALKEFLQLFENEIDRTSDLSFIGDVLKSDLKKFLSNGNVRALLGRPFDPTVRKIETGVLSGTWKAMKLTALPRGFGWANLGQQYISAVRRIQRQGPELRALLDSQNLEENTQSVKAIAGVGKEQDLGKYKESLRKAYAYLKLETLDQGFDHRMHLWKVFVPQRVKKGVPQRELPKDFKQPDQAKAILQEKVLELSSDPEPVLTVLDRIDCRLAVVMGDPGSGKSTLVQYLCLRWAEGDSRELAILVELRKYASERTAPRDLLRYLNSGASVVWQFDQYQLHAYFKAGDALVIFDGLDEVVDRAERETIMTEIIRFSTLYDRAQVIVTSRITGYRKEKLSDAGFQHFTLQDFNDEEIKAFADKWHEIAFTNPDERKRLSGRLQDSITGSRRIHELASNPLLLTLMAILNRNQKLPDERWELYGRASEILLDKWDPSKDLTQEPGRDSISLKEKLGMLRKIANYMQAAPEGLKTNLIHRDQLEVLLVEYLDSLGNVQNSRPLARHFMEELRERNFVLCFSGDEYYSFVHRTFLEYFCASYFRFSIVEDQTMTMEALEGVFAKHWQEDSWNEVLRLIAGMIGLPRSKVLIEFLLESSNVPNATLFAASCFREMTERARVPDVSKRVRAALTSIIMRPQFDSRSNAALRLAFEIWGGDEENHQLIREAAPRSASRTDIWSLVFRDAPFTLWARYWPNDPDLSSLRSSSRKVLLQFWKSKAASQLLGADRSKGLLNLLLGTTGSRTDEI